MHLLDLAPIYKLRVARLRWQRHLNDWMHRSTFASERKAEPLAYRCKRHQSLLRRKLGSTDPEWQENKIVNLGIAGPQVDGVLIRPGELFSFWRLVGDTTAAKGYKSGMELWADRAVAGIGGGICQLANLLYWLALHTPLLVTERHHHSFDPFPDDRRSLPWGSGASVFYNYVDLRFANPTQQTFQFKVWLTEEHLKGEVLTDQPWPYRYHIEERNHAFSQVGERYYRANEIWRHTVNAASGATVSTQLLMRNHGEVRYVPSAVQLKPHLAAECADGADRR